jgi:hypothetical protein
MPSKAKLVVDQNDADSARHEFAVDHQHFVHSAADANPTRASPRPGLVSVMLPLILPCHGCCCFSPGPLGDQ